MGVNCPVCKSEIEEVDRCPICQFEIALYKKIKSISLRLYNKGLEQAQNRDLSGAIDSLLKSIEFDKMNIDARNLLGLVYSEIGQIGQALTQWVISTHYKKEDNIAQTYIDQIQSNGRRLEQYNDSIRMYNQSLEYLKQKSDDLAVIQLKKALQHNPNFVEAYCLLALCFIIQNQREKALSYVEQALEIDMNNSKAIRYYRELKPNSLRPQTKEKGKAIVYSEPRVYSRTTTQMDRKRRSNFSPMGQILGFIVGAICTAAVLFILVIPDKTNSLSRQINDLKVEKQKLEGEITRITNESEETISKLEEENKKMLETNEQLQQKQNALEEAQKISQVDALYKDRKLEEAASLLYSIDVNILPADRKASYNTLVNNIFPEAGRLHYNNGRNAYSKGEFDQAKQNFEKSVLYVKDQYFSDNALYYLGRVYEQKKENEKAKEVYSQVIEQYGGTDGAADAKWRLNNLQ